MLYCDTRQQKGKHRNIDHWFDVHSVTYEYRKLDFGDYMTPDGAISIDTKQDIQEVVGNLGREHARFTRECERAAAAGCQLIVLIEEHPEFEDRRLLPGWTNRLCQRCKQCNPHNEGKCVRYRFRPMQGITVAKIMTTLEAKYSNVQFKFCSWRDTAQLICDTLGVDYDRKK